ncbi:MAG: fenitrothion hydrolase, partial [Solirubrobacterales bacterium]
YLVSHYFTLALYGEQAQFGFLLSDPLGDGSDLFGTAASGIDYAAVSSEAVWYVQVGALVAGHVTALTLGHDRALKVYRDARTAARSQYWMLALMVAFTSLGLYLLSQANS